MKSLRERFDEKWQEVSSGCWEWKGALGGTKSPRPQIRAYGKTTYATHVAWKLYKGEPIKELLICHTCDNPLCVNPAHLFAASQTINMQDASIKGRFRGRKSLNEDIVKKIWELWRRGYKHKEISTVTEIPIGTVGHILTGRRWKLCRCKTYVNFPADFTYEGGLYYCKFCNQVFTQ